MCSTRSYNLYTLTPIKLFITKCPRYWGRVCVCVSARVKESETSKVLVGSV